MSVDYCLLHVADELSAIAWWAAVFEDDPAQAPDGSIQAAVTYWIRIFRDEGAYA